MKHGMSKTRPYSIWRGMVDRCKNKSHRGWENYGGRGISVCDRWKESFIYFWEDMKDGYEDNLQIDRINNDGNYEPGNCRWVTSKENNNNCRRRSSRKINKYYEGNMLELLRENGLEKNSKAFYNRLKQGWTIEEALKTPFVEGKKYKKPQIVLHTKKDCPYPSKLDPTWVSKGKWMCPECKRDVSEEYLKLKGRTRRPKTFLSTNKEN